MPRVRSAAKVGKKPYCFQVPAVDVNAGTLSRYAHLKTELQDLALHKVYEEAGCPNVGKCWSGGTAMIMLHGDICSEVCRFNAVITASKPPTPDERKPFNTAMTVAR